MSITRALERSSGTSQGIEFRHLRAFCAVAEELNFTRAAGRLFIAQQALSAQIRQLEAALGVRLLERTTRRVALTPAGEVLHTEALALLAHLDAAVQGTRAAGQPRTTLTVGFVAALDHITIGPAIAELAARHPELEISIRFGDVTDPTGGLRGGDTDVAFVYGPFDTTGLELVALWDEPLGVMVGEGHPFAALPSVPVARLVEEPTFDFLTQDRRWRDYWMATDHRGGRPPTIAARFVTLDALVEAVRAGLGVHTATRPLVDLAGRGVVWRPVSELAPLVHSVAWRAGDPRGEVALLVEAARAAIQDLPPLGGPPGTGTISRPWTPHPSLPTPSAAG